MLNICSECEKPYKEGNDTTASLCHECREKLLIIQGEQYVKENNESEAENRENIVCIPVSKNFTKGATNNETRKRNTFDEFGL